MLTHMPKKPQRPLTETGIRMRRVQIAAIFASGDRTEALRSTDIPTLVIHGRLDPLVQLSGGEATSSIIPNSKLVIFDDMGHDLPEALWADITSEIISHAQAVVEN